MRSRCQMTRCLCSTKLLTFWRFCRQFWPFVNNEVLGNVALEAADTTSTPIFKGFTMIASVVPSCLERSLLSFSFAKSWYDSVFYGAKVFFTLIGHSVGQSMFAAAVKAKRHKIFFTLFSPLWWKWHSRCFLDSLEKKIKTMLVIALLKKRQGLRLIRIKDQSMWQKIER